MELKKRARRYLPLFPISAVLAVFICLVLFPDEAYSGVISGLQICALRIIPSLFPFFVVSSMLSSLGLPRLAGKVASPVMSRLFGVGGCGASAFILGLTGGYPLGAASVRSIYENGDIKKDEAERLLGFCNNSGPAFIIGVAGVGAFGSSKLGLFLYGVHICAAVLTGVAMRKRARGADLAPPPKFQAMSFASAFSSSVRSAVTSMLNICGFIVLFSVIISLSEAFYVFSSLSGRLALLSGLELSCALSLLSGILEISGGIASMTGLLPTPANLAVCAFILGWGGISVHFQTISVLEGSGLSTKRHLIGKVLTALFSAALAFLLSPLIT